MTEKKYKNSCGASKIPEVDNTAIPCDGKLYNTKCVMEEELIGEFMGGTQSEFNKYIYREIKKLMRLITPEPTDPVDPEINE